MTGVACVAELAELDRHRHLRLFVSDASSVGVPLLVCLNSTSDRMDPCLPGCRGCAWMLTALGIVETNLQVDSVYSLLTK